MRALYCLVKFGDVDLRSEDTPTFSFCLFLIKENSFLELLFSSGDTDNFRLVLNVFLQAL